MTTKLKTICPKNEVTYVIIACCTYDRSELLDRAIDSLLHLDYPTKIQTEILIVDNDKNESAQPVYEKYKDNEQNITIHYVVEEELGLASVRNKALETAIYNGASHLAFIDDDEVAPSDWLVRHIDFYRNTPEVYISSGGTYKKFEKKYPNYITKNNIFKKASSKKHGQHRQACATGNVFFSLEIVKHNNLYFSEAYNFVGGEDGDFFRRASALGYTIAWNDEAPNYEIIGDDRANVKWILTRCYNDGYSGSIVKFKEKKTSSKRFWYTMEKILLIPANLIVALFSLFLGPTCFINSLVITIKNIGKLIGAITVKPTTHYQKRGL